VDNKESNDRFTKLEGHFKEYEVHDPQGEKVGTADDLFRNENGQPEYIGVKTGLLGMLGMRSTLLPIEVCTVDEERRVIEVSESKDHIKDAPSFDGEDVTPEYEDTVRSHFGLESPHFSAERASYGPHYPSDRVAEDYVAGQRTDFGVGEREEEYRERPSTAGKPQDDTATTAESRADKVTIKVEDTVVSKLAGITAQEVEGVQMGRRTARSVGGFVERVGDVGGGGQTRGVSAQVSEDEAVIELDMAIEYGKSVPQVTEAVRRNVIRRVENLAGLRVTEVNVAVNDILLPEERPRQEERWELQREGREQEQRA
jgi:uncharacterized alkaline shock family protein YloU